MASSSIIALIFFLRVQLSVAACVGNEGACASGSDQTSLLQVAKVVQHGAARTDEKLLDEAKLDGNIEGCYTMICNMWAKKDGWTAICHGFSDGSSQCKECPQCKDAKIQIRCEEYFVTEADKIYDTVYKQVGQEEYFKAKDDKYAADDLYACGEVASIPERNMNYPDNHIGSRHEAFQKMCKEKPLCQEKCIECSDAGGLRQHQLPAWMQ